MRNFFAAIELRANDYSSVIRKSLRGQAIGQIGCFARGGTCVRAALRVNFASGGMARARICRGVYRRGYRGTASLVGCDRMESLAFRHGSDDASRGLHAMVAFRGATTMDRARKYVRI
jgi:hypothetical protein